MILKLEFDSREPCMAHPIPSSSKTLPTRHNAPQEDRMLPIVFSISLPDCLVTRSMISIICICWLNFLKINDGKSKQEEEKAE
jgi:hypothetical protein